MAWGLSEVEEEGADRKAEWFNNNEAGKKAEEEKSNILYSEQSSEYFLSFLNLLLSLQISLKTKSYQPQAISLRPQASFCCKQKSLTEYAGPLAFKVRWFLFVFIFIFLIIRRGN